MNTMTLEELLMKEDNATLLDVYYELESRVVPATGYAHAYCRKVNKLINAGKLCTIPDKYRNVYLPTLSKMIFKEMAHRWAAHCHDRKTLEEDTGLLKCCVCGEVFDRSEMYATDEGMKCENCAFNLHLSEVHTDE